MTLAPTDIAAYASDVASVFGMATPWTPPRDEREGAKVRASVVELLAAIRPHAKSPSVGEVLQTLCDYRRHGWPDRSAAARQMAELHDLFEQAAFRRTKRAQRGRLFAQLVVLFELEPAVGLGVANEVTDAEAHLRRVRRSLRGR